MYTSGTTVLGMTDRRLEPELGSAMTQSAVALSSALVSRGPSQTAMACYKQMIYQLGEDGPDRKDTVLFDGGVVLRHFAGREMRDFEKMLPSVARDPKLLETIESRFSELKCSQLEVMFNVGSAARGATRGDSARRISWINALGNVALTDRQDANLREVYAHKLEFDGDEKTIRVFGDSERSVDAKVYDQNPETGRMNVPVIGPELIIDLRTNTIQGRQLRGRIGT